MDKESSPILQKSICKIETVLFQLKMPRNNNENTLIVNKKPQKYKAYNVEVAGEAINWKNGSVL